MNCTNELIVMMNLSLQERSFQSRWVNAARSDDKSGVMLVISPPPCCGGSITGESDSQIHKLTDVGEM